MPNVVDDASMVLDSIRQNTERHEFDVFGAMDWAAAAMPFPRQRPAYLVITDYRLAGAHPGGQPQRLLASVQTDRLAGPRAC